MDMIGRLLVVTSLWQCVTPYKIYQARIPNGNSVPHPCKPGQVWEGVGHFLDQGTGYRNAFGVDFKAAGSQWTKELCEKDSDGDGLTNGQELGDPNCEWKENAIPTRGEGITHPGICDPWESPSCFRKETDHPVYKTQKEWMEAICQSDGFDCDGLKEPDLKNVTLRLSANTRVPGKETTYMCQIFNLSTEGMVEGDHHMIAVEPIIDNTFVLHHMVLFGCEDDVEPTSPFECDMVPSSKCDDFLSVWTVGLAGECYHPNAGVRVGTQGYKKVAVQLHWNNVEKRTDFQDSSGLLVHYTSNRRQYDAGVFLVGSGYFYLPPQQPRVTVHSRCAPSCTRALIQDHVYITTAWNHMHYAGVAMTIEVKRNNSHLSYMTYDQVYSYDSPQLYIYNDNPIKLLPGDELLVDCHFTTAKTNKTIFFGDATQDEMCFGFLTFYPKENLPSSFCLDNLGMSYCDPESYRGCDFRGFSRGLPGASVYKDVKENCRAFAPCLTECRDTILRYMESEPCMKPGSVQWEFTQSNVLSTFPVGQEFLAYVSSCQVDVYLAQNPQTTDPGNSNQGNGNSQTGTCQNNSAHLLSKGQTTLLTGLMILIFALIWN